MSEEYVEDQDSDTGYEEQPVSDLDTPEVAEDEESYSPAESPQPSEEEVIADLDPQVKALGRDMYGRYGNMQGELQTLSKTVSDLVDVVRSQKAETENENTAYGKLEPDQKVAIDELLESHPLIQDLRNQVGGVQQKSVTDNTSKSQQMFSSAIQEVHQSHGESAAREVYNDLAPLANLAKWDLTDPVFQKRLQEHHDRLERQPKERQESRQKASSERGNNRQTARERPKSAKVKSSSGKSYFSFERAVDLAAEEAANKRRSR
jgi:hypothetical protein